MRMLTGILLLITPVFAAPTEVREWSSNAGTRIRAQAISVEGETIVFQAEQRVLRVPLSGLVPADQALLRKHFGLAAPGEIPSAPPFEPDTTITQEKGKATGPVQAAAGSSYFLYVPKSLPKGRKHPLLVILMPHHGKAGSLNTYIAGAERNGWILITSVESANETKSDEAILSVNQAVDHAKKTLPIDPERVFFTGFSGGSSRSFAMAKIRKDVAGILACGMGGVFGTYEDGKIKTRPGIKDTVPLYFVNGTNCWNRKDTGESLAYFCPKSTDSVIRFFPGQHVLASGELLEDGITHLNHVILVNRRTQYAAEAAANEAAILRFASELKTKNPTRAYMWVSFLKERPVDPKNGLAVEALYKELSQDRAAVRWLEGMRAIQGFLVKEMGKDLLNKGPQTPWSNYNKDFQKLLDQYGDTPWKECLELMMKPAQNPT